MLCEHGNQLNVCEICKSLALNRVDITKGFRDNPNDWKFDGLEQNIGIDVSEQVDNPLIQSETSLENRLKTFPKHNSQFQQLNDQMKKKSLSSQKDEILNQKRASDLNIGDSIEIANIPKKFLKKRN